MISFNLLPWREELEQEAKQVFIRHGILAAVLGLALVASAYMSITFMTKQQFDKNTRVENAIKDADSKIIEIKDLKDQIKVLTERKKVVEGLQNNRNQATRIMEQIGQRLPEGVYLSSVKQSGPKVQIIGVALNQSLVANTMTTLDSSDWFSDPLLIEIKGVDAKTPSGAVVKASEFTLDIKFTNPEEVVLPGIGLSPAQQVARQVEASKVKP